MSRYIRPAARLYVEDHTFPEEGPLLPSLSVSEHEAADTGLIWPDGSKVLRAPNPVGFGRDGEWQ